FQAEDGIRDFHVTGVQTCALPIYAARTRMLQGLIQDTFDKAHPHAWELQTATVQHIQHQLDTGTLRKQAVGSRNLNINVIDSIWNGVQPQVVVQTLYR